KLPLLVLLDGDVEAERELAPAAVADAVADAEERLDHVGLVGGPRLLVLVDEADAEVGAGDADARPDLRAELDQLEDPLVDGRVAGAGEEVRGHQVDEAVAQPDADEPGAVPLPGRPLAAHRGAELDLARRRGQRMPSEEGGEGSEGQRAS